MLKYISREEKFYWLGMVVGGIVTYLIMPNIWGVITLPAVVFIFLFVINKYREMKRL